MSHLLNVPWLKVSYKFSSLRLILLISVIRWFDATGRVSAGIFRITVSPPRGAQPASQHNTGGVERSGASTGLRCGCWKLECCLEQGVPGRFTASGRKGLTEDLSGRPFSHLFLCCWWCCLPSFKPTGQHGARCKLWSVCEGWRGSR